jgi:glycosyltransferase involved in cell wall biosynthesis
MYIMASGLSSAGLDVLFVEGHVSRAPVDQPVWQDAEFTMSSDDMVAARQWTWPRWQEFTRQQEWKAPEWLVDVFDLQPPVPPYRTRCRKDRVLSSVLSVVGGRRPEWAAIAAAWESADVLLVSGFLGTVLAAGSGKPFVVWPHGSDARLAVRMHGPSITRPMVRARFEAASAVMRRAYRRALAVGSHDPRVTTPASDIERLERLAPVKLLALPLETRSRIPQPERRKQLVLLFEALGLKVPEADIVALIPSRIDFRLKGHDRLVEAVERVKPGNVHFVFTGWGADLDRARALLAQARLDDHITVLPFAVSKPLIHQLFAVVDLAIDQFALGSYGAAAIEAMANACPVLMWIDGEAFARRGWEAPPVLGARSPAEIATWLARVDSGAVDLERLGASAQSFVARLHAPEAVAAQLGAILEGTRP